MKTEELIQHINRLLDEVSIIDPRAVGPIEGVWTESVQFLRDYGGRNNKFIETLERLDPFSNESELVRSIIIHVLQSFRTYVMNNLLSGFSPERQAQIEVVSDILGQAQNLLREGDIHPAAPTMIIGAALEEFLRNWIEEKKLDMEGKKPGIENYAQILQKNDFIGKQDHKDITSWAGMRNDATHGDWEKVNDRKKADLMLQGVNLFLRLKIDNKSN
jgi:hypothetical protein